MDPNDDDEDIEPEANNLDEETLIKLKRDDLGIARVRIPDVGDFDRTSDGGAIGEDAFLRSLSVSLGGRDNIENVEALFDAISRNRSIEHLSLFTDPNGDPDDLPDDSGPFFERNRHFRSLYMFDVTMMYKEFAQSMVSALSRCTSLHDLGMSCLCWFGNDKRCR